MSILQNVTIQRTGVAAGAAIELRSNSQLAFLSSRLLDNPGAGVVSTPTPSSLFEDCEISLDGADGIAASAFCHGALHGDRRRRDPDRRFWRR